MLMPGQGTGSKTAIVLLIVLFTMVFAHSSTESLETDDEFWCEDIDALDYILASRTITDGQIEMTYLHAHSDSEIYIEIRQVSDAFRIVREMNREFTAHTDDLSQEFAEEGFVYVYDWSPPCGLDTDNRFAVMTGDDAYMRVAFLRVQALDVHTLIYIDGMVHDDIGLDGEGLLAVNLNRLLWVSRELDIFERHAMKLADRMSREEARTLVGHASRFDEQGIRIFYEEDLHVPGMSALGLERTTTGRAEAKERTLYVTYVPTEVKHLPQPPNRITMRINQYPFGGAEEAFHNTELQLSLIAKTRSDYVREETDTRKGQVRICVYFPSRCSIVGRLVLGCPFWLLALPVLRHVEVLPTADPVLVSFHQVSPE